MQPRNIRRVLQLWVLQLSLILAFSCACAALEAGQDAPRFVTSTLDGQKFTNASLDGSVTLLQFWATWCPHCRADQPAVDEVDRKFAGQGLVVLAIDVGESPATVAKYLRENPRTVRIALDQHKQLPRRFGMKGYPYYVLIDRQGRVAGTAEGEVGEKGLLALLSRAGLRDRASARQAAARGGARNANAAGVANAPGDAANPSEPPPPSPPKMIELPPERNAPPAKPLSRTLFVLSNGERLESDHYTLDAHFLNINVGGEQRTIPTSALDVNATESANRARGIDLKIPSHKGEVFVAF